MQLLINNTVSGDHWIEDLVGPKMLIGRPGHEGKDNSPEVALPSMLVSRSHAVLRDDNGSWSIEHMGVNDTLLDDQPLAVRETVPVKPGDELRIGEYVLLLVDRAQGTDDTVTDVGLTRLMEFEHVIHTDLLELMDLRRGEDKADLESEETREKIETYLNNLLDKGVAGLPKEDIDEILSIAVYQRVSMAITASGSKNTITIRHADEGPYEAMLSDIQKRMAEEMGISFKPRDMEKDAATLDKNFARVFKQYDLEFGRGLRSHLIHSLVRREILDLIYGLGPLQDLIDMDVVSEIMVVSRSQIFVEKSGVVEDSRRAFFSDEMLMAVIERIVAPVGRRIDRSSPLVDARLPDGSRVNVVIPPLAVKGPCVTIRKFAKVPLEIEDLIGFGALDETMSRFLRACCTARKNILVSGGTGTGKTTLLNCLSRYIPYKERIVTIEDTAELQLKQPHVVTLESRPPNMEGKGAVTIRDLVKNALRMRPDRIVVGECRGAETLDMLQAMNTGHDGSMTTAHANSPADVVLRLETMVLTGTDMPLSAIREQICTALDVVVQLTRFSDGGRRVTQVSEVIEIDQDTGEVVLEDIFTHQPGSGDKPGRYIHTGYVPTFIDELLRKGGITLKDFF